MKLKQMINKIFEKGNGTKDEKKVTFGVTLLLFGLLLIISSNLFLATPKEKRNTDNEYSIEDARINEEKRLKKELMKINGIKEVSVLISFSNTGITEPLTEEKTVLKNQRGINDAITTETQKELKPIYDGDKNIIKKTEYMPEIKGVSVFYSGEKNESIEKKLYRATVGALGCELHKIEVIHTKDS